jgi:creatinine amidohydrolase
MTWKELKALPKEQTIVFITIAPLQAHGPHLPVGMDGYTSQAIALATAKEFCKRKPQWHALVAPHIPIGTHTFSFFGTIDCSPTVIRKTIEQWGTSLSADGFQYIMVISSHSGPGHIRALEDGCNRISKKLGITMIAPMGYKIASYFAGNYDEKLKRLSRNDDDFSYSEDIHGGRMETSLALYLSPDLVKSGYKNLKPVKIEPAEFKASILLETESKEGYIGSPALASQELGKGTIISLARSFTGLLLQTLDGEDISERIHSSWGDSDYLNEYSTVTAIALGVVTLLLLISLIKLIFA